MYVKKKMEYENKKKIKYEKKKKKKTEKKVNIHLVQQSWAPSYFSLRCVWSLRGRYPTSNAIVKTCIRRQQKMVLLTVISV